MLAYTNTEFIHLTVCLNNYILKSIHVLSCVTVITRKKNKTQFCIWWSWNQVSSLQQIQILKEYFQQTFGQYWHVSKNNQTLLNDEKIPRVHLKDWKKWKNNWILCKLEKHKSPRYVNYIKKVDTVSGLYIPKQVSTIFYREIRGLFSCLPTHFNVLVSLNDNHRKEHFSLF